MAFGWSGGSDIGSLAAVFLIGFRILSDKSQRSGGHVLSGESELLHDLVARCGGAEMIDADDGSVVAGPSMPSKARRGFNRDALFDALRKDAFTVGLVLPFEDVPT